MSTADQTSRRGFLFKAGAAGATLLSASAAVEVKGSAIPCCSESAQGPDAVLTRLVEGNDRFVSGKSQRVGRKPEDFLADAKGRRRWRLLSPVPTRAFLRN